MNSMKIMFMAVLMVNMYVGFVQQKQKYKKYTPLNNFMLKKEPKTQK